MCVCNEYLQTYAVLCIWLANMTGDLFLLDFSNKQRTNLLLLSLQIHIVRSSCTHPIFKCHFFKSTKRKHFHIEWPVLQLVSIASTIHLPDVYSSGRLPRCQHVLVHVPTWCPPSGQLSTWS